MYFKRSLAALMTGLFLTLVGCAESQPAVNRVQANVLEKSQFVGEWYFLQTVIDTPYSATYSFVGEQGNTEKIVWEIQEDVLIARRSYSFIAEGEEQGIAGETETGAAVAMFAITSHFDIQRDYNPITGEEQNVISENTVDRPWNERTYFRVDWSKNLITNNDFLIGAKIFDGIQSEPVAYYVQDLPNGEPHPHAPKFINTDDDEANTVEYMDIVNKMFIRPTEVNIPGFGKVPTCFLVGSGHLDCAPGELTVRNSFLKVNELERDYQPMLYTGDRMEKFGYFVTERAGYDEQYGLVEPSRYRFVNRHNLWAQSHRFEENNTIIPCRDDSQCGGGGSKCDVAWGQARRQRDGQGRIIGACTLPYRERGTRPIAYHVSKDFPEALEANMQAIAESWNVAFSTTAESLRVLECEELGEANCEAEREREDTAQMFVMCHNPVIAEDHEACGPEGTSAEIGDLRYNLLGWVQEPHSFSPLGYGPSSADPETGEIIMGNAFVYGAGVDTLATFARDIIGLLNDDIDDQEITNGDVVDAWVERQQAPTGRETGLPRDDHAIPVDGYNVDRINAAMDFSWAAEGADNANRRARPSSVREFIARMEESTEHLDEAGAFGHDHAPGAALQNIIGTDIEQMLITDEVKLAAGVDPRTTLDDATMDQVSPLRGMSLGKIRALENARNQIRAEQCVLDADFIDDGLLGLARTIKRAADSGTSVEWYGQTYELNQSGDIDYRLVRDMLMQPIFHGVMAHEIGHTIGLRHNFSGSYDAMNYHPRYWELRDDGDMQSRAWDPLSEAEIDGRINEYAYSTVMDYGNNFVVTDAQGVGHYDIAAIKMGYGDMVEVFTEAESADDVAWFNFIQGAGWPVPLKLDAFLPGGEVTAYSYTEYPSIVGGRERMEGRADVRYTELTSNPFLASQGLPDPLQDAAGRPTVPYLFCSDEQADLGPDCQRYDAGPDAYEAMTSVIDNYENYYIFNAFRRGRLGFGLNGYVNRVYGRYFEKMQSAAQVYALYRGVFSDIFGGEASYDEFWTRPDGMGPWTAAVGASFQALTKVITTPEPGGYGADFRPDGSRALLSSGGQTVRVDNFDGRFLETTWNFDAGYFWFDQLERAGFFYDKVLAIEIMTDPTTYFLGRDTSADLRRYQISFYNAFGPAVTNLMKGVMAEDWDTIAPRVEPSTGELRYPDALELTNGSMEGMPLDPAASFSIQLYASLYSMFLIPETFDQTYLNEARIYVRGGAESIEFGEDVALVEFTDPYSGLTYVSVSYQDEEGQEQGVGANMLLHAQAMLDTGNEEDMQSYIDNINIVRRLTWLLGFGG